MKRFIYVLITIAAALSAFSIRGVEPATELVVYPMPPDSMVNLRDRCDFIINRFWDRCNFEQAVLHPQEFNKAFGDWIAIMPHASADTVYAAIDKVLERNAKKKDIILTLATMAENWLYSDTAQYRSTDIYLPFARAAASNKKISKAERARFEAQAKVMESSSVGATIPVIPIVHADGSKGTTADLQGGSILLFFNDPDCSDCSLARARLSCDYATSELVKKGTLTIVSVYPGNPEGESWEKSVKESPEGWITVAMPKAYDYFELSSTPMFYFLSKAHKVLRIEREPDGFIDAFRMANNLENQKK